MRCQFSNSDDEMNPPVYNIWTSGNLQTPNILKSILNPCASQDNLSSCFTENLSNLCNLEAASSSQKRKIPDYEKGDFEERFHKVQRKKQLRKVVARANLIVDDEDDSDDEDKIYQQMDWIEKENAMNAHYNSSSDEDDSLLDYGSNTKTSVLLIPKSRWKDERRRLLRISMAKIQGVEDPEAYLRRSVLINNTVKRLQNDIPLNYMCHSVASSFFQGNITYQNDSLNTWDASVICKQQYLSNSFEFEYQYASSRNGDVDYSDYHEVYHDLPCSVNFHLSCASVSSDKIIDTLHREGLHNGPSLSDKSSLDDQRTNDAPLPIVLKQPSALHAFSSQPCGLQYRSPMHAEDPSEEYHESSSSILDSVVYHGLMTSLES